MAFLLYQLYTREPAHAHALSVYIENPPLVPLVPPHPKNTLPKKQQHHQPQLPIPTPPPGTPQWITNQLQTRQNCKRQAQLQTCPNCGALTLYGYNEDTAAWPTRTDPTLLTYQQQQTLHTAGRPLYQLTTNTTATAWLLYYATGPNHATKILTNHKCHYPTQGTPLLTPKTKPLPPDAPPPF